MTDGQLMLEIQRQLVASEHLVNVTMVLVLVMIAKEVFYVVRSFRKWLLGLQNGDDNAPVTLRQLQEAMQVAGKAAAERTENAVERVTRGMDVRFSSVQEELRGTNKRLEKIRDIARDVRNYVILGKSPSPADLNDE
jgi:hypothetical protein